MWAGGLRLPGLSALEPHRRLDSGWHRFPLMPLNNRHVFRGSTSVTELCSPVPVKALPCPALLSQLRKLFVLFPWHKAALGPCHYLIQAQPAVSELSKIHLLLLKQCWEHTEPLSEGLEMHQNPWRKTQVHFPEKGHTEQGSHLQCKSWYGLRAWGW